MIPLPYEQPMLAWLVAVQFVLYAAGWWLCAALAREERPAAGHWGAAMALCAGAVCAIALRGGTRAWLPDVGSDLLLLAAFVALRRGMERFLRLPPADREHLAVLLAAGSALAFLGPDAAADRWRNAVLYAAATWVLARAGLMLWRELRSTYERPAAALLAAVPLLFAVLFAGLLAAQASAVAWPAKVAGVGLVPAIADIAGAAVFNLGLFALLVCRLVCRIREESHRDELTGLANRRRIDCLLPVEWQRLQRGGTEFGLLRIDIDHFGDVNQRHGRGAGDRMLSELAQRLRYTAREIDLVARTGGGEFLVMTPQTCLDGARTAAERLRNAVNAMPFTAGGNPVTLSVSVGVAVAKHSDLDLADVFERAATALKRAKDSGRNRVCLEDA